jgi:class 3 adenylate cyclase
MANLSIKSKLLVMLLAVSIASIAIVATLNYRTTYHALQNGAFAHLTTVRTSRASQIEQLLERLIIEVRTSGRGVSGEAAREFIDAFHELESVEIGPEKETRLRNYYREQFLPAVAKSTGAQPDISSVFPDTAAARYLQYEYIANNPFPEDERAEMLRADDDTAYSRVHEAYHHRLTGLFLGMGFSNVLLVDIDSGAVVYSARKYASFGTRLSDGPFARGHLGDLFRTLQRSPDVGRVVVADFQPHRARTGVPTAFIGTPLFVGGRAIALLLVELPADAIDRVMTNDRQWEHDGLGRTGEVYLVGSDHLMRSNSRGLIESPERYAQRLRSIKTPEADIERILQQGTTILNQTVHSYPIEQAITGNEGTGVVTGYTGAEILASWAPLRVAGLHWAIVAKIDREEAYAPMRKMARDTLIETLVIVLVITFVVMFLATSFVRPVNNLIARVQLARSGKPDVAFETETGDEIGELARSFRELIDGVQKQAALLEQATAQNHRLLENVMPKGMAQRVKVGAGGITEQIDDVSVVFAELKGLAEYTRTTSDANSVAVLQQLIGAFDEAASRHGVERIKTVGDTYHAVAGFSQPLLDHARRAVEFALDARSIVRDFNRVSSAHLGLTVGICAGPVIADVMGQDQFQFQLWGAAVIDADYAMDCGGIDEIVVTRGVRDSLADQYRFEPLQAATPQVPLWTLVERN